MPAIRLEDVSRDAFAAYGDLLIAPQPGSGRVDIVEALENLRPAARPRLTLMVAEPRKLPFRPVEMERHVHSSQAFLPLSGADYLVMVAPGAGDDRPDVTRLRAFKVPGDVGINYRPNVWHHPIATLGGPGRFAVWTFIDGTGQDEEFVSLSETVTIGP